MPSPLPRRSPVPTGWSCGVSSDLSRCGCYRGLTRQLAERAQVDDVPGFALCILFGRFQIHRNVLEAFVSQQVTKAGSADLATADVLVPVDPGAELTLGVVEVNGFQPVEAELRV